MTKIEQITEKINSTKEYLIEAKECAKTNSDNSLKLSIKEAEQELFELQEQLEDLEN